MAFLYYFHLILPEMKICPEDWEGKQTHSHTRTHEHVRTYASTKDCVTSLTQGLTAQYAHLTTGTYETCVMLGNLVRLHRDWTAVKSWIFITNLLSDLCKILLSFSANFISLHF